MTSFDRIGAYKVISPVKDKGMCSTFHYLFFCTSLSTTDICRGSYFCFLPLVCEPFILLSSFVLVFSSYCKGKFPVQVVGSKALHCFRYRLHSSCLNTPVFIEHEEPICYFWLKPFFCFCGKTLSRGGKSTFN